MFFVWRSFYGMRIPKEAVESPETVKKEANILFLEEDSAKG
jgi:hypothetical protein